MDATAAYAISASGLRAQRLRMDVIAANLANAQSTRTPDGGPYRRHEVVLEAQPTSGTFEDALNSSNPGVRVARIVADDRPPQLVFDPGHPDADAKGYVAMPNVNVVTEMVDMMAATRAYEANVAALNAAKTMAMKTLDIGNG
jgi:flagellar basal-body rod protein FlgC